MNGLLRAGSCGRAIYGVANCLRCQCKIGVAQLANACLLRVQLDAIPPRPRQIARIPKLQLPRIGLPPQVNLLIPHSELRFRGLYARCSRFEEAHAKLILRQGGARGSDACHPLFRQLRYLRQ